MSSDRLSNQVRRLRFEHGQMTQQQLADEIGLSRVSYRKLIMGGGKFENVIAVLQALGKVDLLQNFIPETTFSPMEQLKLQGKQRRRATSALAIINDKETADKLDW